jgi:transglutaminase-like putative cysteine protease
VHERVAYVIGATHVHTSAAEALKDGMGVYQDHAHIFISAARALGLPARYVSGYFLTDSDEPSEAHHAWAEVWIKGLGWLGFDPANRLCPTDRYVRLACGLDSASAAPVRGTRRGGVQEVLDVTVEVQQQSAQQ